jgi:hypothetical protein
MIREKPEELTSRSKIIVTSNILAYCHIRNINTFYQKLKNKEVIVESFERFSVNRGVRSKVEFLSLRKKAKKFKSKINFDIFSEKGDENGKNLRGLLLCMVRTTRST